MIVDILAVVDGSFLDFVDGFIDFVYGLLFLITQFPTIRTLQMGACVTEIRQSMKISRMLSRRLRLCRNERRNEEQKSEKDEHQSVNAFHLMCGSYSNEYPWVLPVLLKRSEQTNTTDRLGAHGTKPCLIYGTVLPRSGQRREYAMTLAG